MELKSNGIIGQSASLAGVFKIPGQSGAHGQHCAL